MKNIIHIIIFLVLALFSCEKPQSLDIYDWKDISLNKNLALKTIYMVSDEVGYVGGFSNIEIAKTITYFGNDTFGDTLIYSPGNGFFYKEYQFVENQILEPVLYKTNNGGTSWQEIKTPFKIGVKDMQFIDEFIGYVAAEGEGIYKTIDGGQNWTKLLENVIHYYNGLVYSDPFNSICFLDENKGFVYDNINQTDILFSTRDGGESWKCISIDYPSNVTGSYPTLFNDLDKVVFFNSSDTGYIVNNSEIYKSVDMGVNWEIIYNSESIQAQNVHFISPQIGYLSDLKLVTKDGGNTWSDDTSKIHGDDMVLINKKEFYYIENGLIIRKLVGQNEPYYMTKETDRIIFDLFFPSNNVGYAIGEESVILKYTRISVE